MVCKIKGGAQGGLLFYVWQYKEGHTQDRLIKWVWVVAQHE